MEERLTLSKLQALDACGSIARKIEKDFPEPLAQIGPHALPLFSLHAEFKNEVSGKLFRLAINAQALQRVTAISRQWGVNGYRKTLRSTSIYAGFEAQKWTITLK